MKVLIVSVSFYPEVSPRSFRATELAKELRRQEVEVEVAGIEVNGKLSAMREEFLNRHDISWQNLGTGNWAIISENWQKRGGVLRLIGRLLGYFAEFPQIEWYFKIPNRLKIANNTTAIISIAKPFSVHWGLSRLYSKRGLDGARWIADCGDPFMLSSLNVRKIPFYFSYFEKSFCRDCDYIVTPVREGHLGYYPEFRHKIKVIPQGFNFEDDRRELGKYTGNEIVTFVYAGAFLHKGRNPQALLKYLKEIDIDFRFYIFTQQKYLVEPYVDGDKRFIINDLISRKEILQVLSQADFVINMMNGTSVQVPSKLIDYFIVGRPVLNIESDALELGEKKTIDEFLAGNYENRLEFENMECYNIVQVANEFIHLMNTPIEQK